VGPLVIDLGAKTITSDGLPIVLTAREFAILGLLALHRNKVVSRTTIYDHIFDEDDDSLSNLVDVHVSNLRKKIGKEWIETRRGQGYILHG
jgi:two-component system OmpR family response regulator